MTTSDQASESSNRRIFVGLAIGIAIGITLNAAPYLLFAMPSAEDAAKFHMPQLHRLGFPRTFWLENRNGTTSFYWGAFLLDAVATLGIGIGIAQWLDKRGNAGVAPSEESPPTERSK